MYKQIVAHLKYLYNSKLDIPYEVVLVYKFMENFQWSHLLATKRILRYVKCALDLELLFNNNKDYNKGEVNSFSNGNWNNDTSDRKGTSRYAFLFKGIAFS